MRLVRFGQAKVQQESRKFLLLGRIGLTMATRVWSMWAGDEGKVFQAVVDAYNRKHPTRRVANLGGVEDSKTIRAIIAGGPPDFFTLREPGYLAPLASRNALLPLDDRFAKAGFRPSDFISASLDQGRVAGRLYSMPFLLDAAALFWNPDLFAKAGLPERAPRTLEETLELAKALTKFDRFGNVERLGMRPPEPMHLLAAFGARIARPETGEIMANAPECVEAFEWFRKLVEVQGGGKKVQAFTAGFGNEQGTNNPFFVSKIAMMINGQWNPYWFQIYAPKVRYEVSAIPHPIAKPQLARPTVIGQNMFCIPRESKDPEGAWVFMQWMQSDEAQILFADTMHGIPNIRRLLKEPKLRQPQNGNEAWKRGYAKFLDLVDSPNARYFPTVSVANLYLNELTTAQDYVMSGTKSPRQALNDAQRRVQREANRR